MTRFMCCRCTRRTAVMVVAVLSTLHFIIESAAVIFVGDNHRLVLSTGKSFFYSFVASQMFLVILSILLFVGAVMRLFWFCVPWLVMTVLNVFYHTYVLIVLVIKTITAFDETKLEMLFLITFSGTALAYMAHLVFSYIQDLRRSDGRRDNVEEDQYPLVGDSNRMY